MDIKIRSERISDYSSVANVNYEAFLGWHPDNQYVSEPVLVDLLRHNSLFDPELSLVAEFEGKVIGHVLFSPFRFIVLGREQMGVILAPAAVKPEFQNKGVGSRLIEEGHRKAKEKGFVFSLLCGHEGYYPRFGYKTAMFSETGANVNICREDFDHEGFNDRPVKEEDIKWIPELWKSQHATEAIALMPGENISEWSNQGMHCRCSVVSKNNRILGYVRYASLKRLNIKELVAKSEDVPDILAYLVWKSYGKAQGEMSILLPAEKINAMLVNSGNYRITEGRIAHKAFMMKVLQHAGPVEDYCEKVEKGLIKPGIIAFPAMFDIDDGRDK
ncbi:hypothetical protein CLHUN_26670 [Ruminiclostridium hungatei]|uniref:N-acetyltransferase domain-containing protein n=1 Tax=Ruminiclostridium hungatei TaxID=48256 RepID=A0A1V4SI24_RUMHU|nr:N-acetyltransferase [Ruminiclostridium hungatei]OPX43520.1 hypothetical protein CLHUN_26670 [Ruminiclostridium hungatei]